MKLISLELENLRQHASTSIRLPESGIIGIVGPNESGKSTLLEAVTWALYGSRALRGTKGSLRWNRAPARRVATVVLGFEVGGKRYEIQRSESDAKLFEISGGAKAPIAEGTSAVDAHVPQLVGMTLAEFSATYLCAQRDLGRIAAMGPTERRQFVLGVMGLDRIDAALETVRGRKNELAREIDGVAAGLGDRAPLVEEWETAAAAAERLQGWVAEKAAAVAGLDDRYQAAAGRLLALDQQKDRHNELERENREALHDAEVAEEEIEAAAAEFVEAKAAAERVADAAPKLARLPELRSERDALKEAEARASERAGLQEAIDYLESEIGRLSSEMADLQATIAAHDEGALEECAERYRELDPELSQIMVDREAARAEAKAESDAAASQRDETLDRVRALRDVGADSPCPTCTRPLGEHFDEVIAALEAAAGALDAQAKAAARRALDRMDPSDEERKLAEQVAALRERGEQLKENRAAARAAETRIGTVRHMIEAKGQERGRRRERLDSIPAVEFSAEQLKAVEDRIAKLEYFEREAVAHDRAKAAAADSIRQRRDRHRSAHSTALARHATATEAQVQLGYDAAAHAELQDDVNQLRGRLEEARQDRARAEERLAGVEHRRDRAEHLIDQYDERADRLDALRDDLHVHTAAADRLNAFRIQQAALIRPELEELTTGFIAILTDGRHDGVTITEDFEVILEESGLATEVVSGGTEDVAAIALRLAISQMIAERAGHPLSLLVLDEPFGSLDEVRRGNVLTLIRRLAAVFAQVLVISHVAETKDAVDHVIELAYDEAAGCSRVVGAPVDAAAVEEAAA